MDERILLDKAQLLRDSLSIATRLAEDLYISHQDYSHLVRDNRFDKKINELISLSAANLLHLTSSIDIYINSLKENVDSNDPPKIKLSLIKNTETPNQNIPE